MRITYLRLQLSGVRGAGFGWQELQTVVTKLAELSEGSSSATVVAASKVEAVETYYRGV